MGKTRSSGRMRKYKSRNRRGGLFGLCLNCSPEKKMFKKLKTNIPQLCGHVNGLMLDKQNSLYDELHKPEEKYNFIHCLVQSHVNTDKYSESIKDDIKKYENRQQLIQENIRQEKERILDEQTKHREYLKSMPRKAEDPVVRTTGSTRGLGGFHKPIKDTILPDDVADYQYTTQDMNFRTRYIPYSEGADSEGGKSRRRHRRGRTLHKRRKSSKVRKTRRTHSRSRR
jgi:hypothetical protein